LERQSVDPATGSKARLCPFGQGLSNLFPLASARPVTKKVATKKAIVIFIDFSSLEN
jgi:hypothetical protein